MALVVVCGQPCSGKSTAALCRAESLKDSESKLTVRIVDEDSLHLDRNESYANMTAEKNLRRVLRSEVDRPVSKENIIIVDSLNSVKCYREKGEAAYDDTVFLDLARRFERPERRNRWDSPMFELFLYIDGIQKSCAAILDAVSYLTNKANSNSRDVKILQPTIATQNTQFSEANSQPGG